MGTRAGVDICLYFQVHQPWRLRPYRYVEVGRNHDYFDHGMNSQILRKVAEKCYLPMNNLLMDLIREHGPAFKASFSVSGTFIQQCEAYAPEVLGSFRRLFETGQVELLSETSHHSLASLHSVDEFRAQIALHRELCRRYLIEPSRVFRNTELIMNNEIARVVSELGYEAICIEGADHILRWRSPLFKYHMAAAPRLVALLKNYRLSDDIAFRFSDRSWSGWSLTSEKFTSWVRNIEHENPVKARGGEPFLGLFMDYETFGEHQWASSGIFDFMRALPAKLLEFGRFVTPTEAARQPLIGEPSGEGAQELESSLRIDAPEAFSWADVDRDLSAWQGNSIQDSALREVYNLEKPVRARAAALAAEGRAMHGAALLETWRRLLTSDHFYYMCTKYFADGDVHRYFSPYESPFDAHILYMNVLADLSRECGAGEAAA
jgi:alpha-amylase